MTFDKVKAIVAKELNVDEEKIQMETHLIEDLGADSLDAVELIMALEDEFGIEVDDDAAQNAKTIGDLVNYIDSKIKNAMLISTAINLF